MSAVPEFSPRRFLRNGHLQTIAGNFMSRVDNLPPAEQELVEVAPATGELIAAQVLCLCHWQPERSAAPTAILLHGLEGSSNSQYVVGNGNKFWRSGFNVIRMNMRNCGGTERLSPTLYHSGLASDINAVLRHFLAAYALPSVALIGYSMGGNMVLRAASDLGADAPPQLRSVVAISPAIYMSESSDALHEPRNRVYEIKFLRALIRRYRLKAQLFPRLFDPARADGIRSLRQFDDRIIAHYYGFAGAEDYYYNASAARTLAQLSVPTLIVHSVDDPFIYITDPTKQLITANPNITYVETAHGGHCAFLEQPTPDYDGYWAEHTLLRFVLEHAKEIHAG